MQADEVFSGLDGGLWDRSALVHDLELLVVVAGLGNDAAVVHAVDIRHRRDEVGQDIGAFHALTDSAADILRKKRRGIGSLEELLHGVAASAADVDIKALELSGKGVQTFERGTGVVLGRVKLFKRRGQTAARLIHALLNRNILKFSHKNTS